MKQKIILIGGGGHCKSCIDVIEQEGSYEIAGIVDVKEKVGDKILGYPIIGTDKDIEQISKQYDNFLITIGQLKTSAIRTRLFTQLTQLNKNIPSIISPSAYVSKHAKIGAGTIVMHHAIVNASAIIGNNCIVNTNSLIEHDVTMGNHNHVSTFAVVNGGVIIGNDCLIGSGTTIIQSVSIGNNVTLGAGAVVSKNITEQGVYIGVPAKKKL